MTGFLWQARQSGAGFTPVATAFPCSEATKCFWTSSWQSPHSCAWRPGAKRNFASLTGVISCDPWQSAQPTVVWPGLPAIRAISGWNGCAGPAWSWQEAQLTGFSFVLCGKSDVRARSAWQSTQATPAWPWTEASNLRGITCTDFPFFSRLASASA